MSSSSRTILKKTPITDKNGVKTSRLKKPIVVGQAATPAAASSNRLAASPLAPRPATYEEEGAQLTRLAASYFSEWPELDLDMSSATPVESAAEHGVELNEYLYAAAVETLLTDEYEYEDAHGALIGNRPSVRNAFTAGFEPSELAEWVSKR